MFAKYSANFEYVPIITPIPIFDKGILNQTKAIYWQRKATPNYLGAIRRIKALQEHYKFKLIWDCDDQLTGKNELQGGEKNEGIPSYNPGHLSFGSDELQNSIGEFLSYMDLMTTSTQFLLDLFKKTYKEKCPPGKLVTNVLPEFLWHCDRKKDITSDLVKPKVLYCGSPCHYTNPVPAHKGFPGLSANLGDWNNAWLPWIKNKIQNDEIEFICMGGIPYFFNELKSKIKFLDWVECNNYPKLVLQQNCDISIMPLTENEFNCSKSSLKAREAYAAGMVCLGTIFNDPKFPSPYNEIHPECQIKSTASIEDIDKAFNWVKKKENWNLVKNWQYKLFDDNQWWLESERHQKLITSIFD